MRLMADWLIFDDVYILGYTNQYADFQTSMLWKEICKKRAFAFENSAIFNLFIKLLF